MLNRIDLMGRLTADPELRNTTGDHAVTSFRLAVERDFKNGDEKQVDYINITAWRKTAEFVAKYFNKGQLVAISGALQSRQYTDKDGNNRTAYEVVADKVYFAESKKKTESGFQQDPSQFASEPVTTFEDDDLPF